MRRRRCSECGSDLGNKRPQAKTCTTECRAKRSRRLRDAKKRSEETQRLPEHAQELTEIVRGERDDVVERVVQEEIRPVVREAITEETMRAIQDLVGLTPRVVAAISEDLASEDAVIRQRAYTLVAKYTIGHPAVVRPPEETAQKQLIVNFELPRPGDTPVDAEASAVELQEDEFRQCDLCGADKPVTSFVAGSNRCADCYEGQQAKAKQLLEGISGD